MAQSGNPKTRPAKGAQLIRRQADINDLDATPDRDIAEDDVEKVRDGIIGDIGAVADFHIESARRRRARRNGFNLAYNARVPNGRRHAIARDFDRFFKADILGMRFNRPGIIRGDAIDNLKPRRAHQNLKLPLPMPKANQTAFGWPRPLHDNPIIAKLGLGDRRARTGVQPCLAGAVSTQRK